MPTVGVTSKSRTLLKKVNSVFLQGIHLVGSRLTQCATTAMRHVSAVLRLQEKVDCH